MDDPVWQIRPEIATALVRYREALGAGLVVVVGLWLVVLGGYVLVPLGVIVAAIGAALTLTALRRARFVQTVAAPGVVDLDERQISYLAPELGGFISLDELVEIRLLSMRGHRMWRLKQADGQALLIPIDATGAEMLFDVFASLPGMDTAALVVALNTAPPEHANLTLAAETRVIWRKQSGRTLAR